MTPKLFFYSLTLPSVQGLVGASCNLQKPIIYFSTQAKLERWLKNNLLLEKSVVWGMHEISVQCLRELAKLSKKKPKCHECGK